MQSLQLCTLVSILYLCLISYSGYLFTTAAVPGASEYLPIKLAKGETRAQQLIATSLQVSFTPLSLISVQGAGEQSSSERRPWDTTDTKVLRVLIVFLDNWVDNTYFQSGHHFSFFLSVQKVVMVLHRDKGCQLVVDCVVLLIFVRLSTKKQMKERRTLHSMDWCGN